MTVQEVTARRGRAVGSPPPRARAHRRLLPRLAPGPSWPLIVLLGGFPVWWLLGLNEVLVFAMSTAMALQLVRRRAVVVPPGFGWWLIFLGLVVIGIPLLFVDVPGTVTGGGANRLPVFFYRLAWYFACTVLLLWVGNLDERELPTKRVVALFGWLFVVTVAGGLLGVFFPRFELTSLMEVVLPRSLATQELVQTIIHPRAADIQSVLGPGQARPIAPFAYANSWGSNLSLTLPFFVVGWLMYGTAWRRLVAPFVLAASVVPIVYSLNRGLWACLALGAVLLAVRLALAGRAGALVGMGVAIVVTVGAVALSPLGDTIVSRVNNPHSNERRSQLLTATVDRTIESSPVAGFGSTRRVQGNFDSIAGGSRPGCKACGVPPLGTQGHVWLVIFSQGIGGLIAFVGFFASQLLRHWRGRTTLEMIGVLLLASFGVQLFIYDTLGWPVLTVMVGIALMWRERWRAAARGLPVVPDSMRAAR